MLSFIYYSLIHSIHVLWWPKDSHNETAKVILRGYHTFSHRFGWDDQFHHTREMTLLEHHHSIQQCLQFSPDYYNNMCVYFIQHKEGNHQCILNGSERCDGRRCQFMCLKFEYQHQFVFIENDTFDDGLQQNSAFQLHQSGVRGVVFKVDDPFTNSVSEGPFNFAGRIGYYYAGYTGPVNDDLETDG